MLVLLVLAARLGADLLGIPRRRAVLGALAWAPAAAGVASGQNTSLALLLVVLAARALTVGRDTAAGLAIGTLGYKAQLSAPLAGLLALRGRFAGVAGLVAAIVAGYLLSVVATGGNAAWPVDWLATLRAYAPEDLRVNGWQAVSVPPLLARWDPAGGPPLGALTGYALGAAVVLVTLPALRRWPVVPAVALASAAGLVVSPHAWVYDATLLLPAVGIFAARAAARGWPPVDRWLVAAAYAIVAAWPLGGFIGVTPAVLVVVAAPFVLLRRAAPEPADR